MNSKGLPRSFAFKISPQARAGKLDRLEAVQAEWSRVLPLAFSWHWKGFLKGGLFENLPRSGPKSTFPKTKLVTSQKDLMAVAIQGQAQGWASNLNNRFAKALMRMQGLDPMLRREMLWINAMRAWILPLNAPPGKPGQVSQRGLLAAQPAKPGALASISPRASRLMRKIFWAYVGRHKLPDPLGLPLQVNQQSFDWGAAKRSASKWAHSWLSVASLEPGKRIALPLLGHDHADARGGERAKTFSLAKRGGEWFAISTQYVDPKPWAKSGVDVLRIDLGMRNLLATSEGDLFGRGFLAKLSKLDRELVRIQKGLLEAGEKRLSSCKRYRKIVERIRGLVKTEVQTAVGQALRARQPKKVAIEALCFSEHESKLSRRMNRLICNFGQSVFKQTLGEKSEEFGFAVVEVDPAYTSQACSKCSFALRSNRKNEQFKCKSCGHLAHADVNAAKNIAKRLGDSLANNASSKWLGGPKAWWEGALSRWLAEQIRRLSRGPSPFLPGLDRAAGSARMGLKSMLGDKRSAERLGPLRRACFEEAARSKSTKSLFEGLRGCLP